jgi:hypothetical protein
VAKHLESSGQSPPHDGAAFVAVCRHAARLGVQNGIGARTAKRIFVEMANGLHGRRGRMRAVSDRALPPFRPYSLAGLGFRSGPSDRRNSDFHYALRTPQIGVSAWTGLGCLSA